MDDSAGLRSHLEQQRVAVVWSGTVYAAPGGENRWFQRGCLHSIPRRKRKADINAVPALSHEIPQRACI